MVAAVETTPPPKIDKEQKQRCKDEHTVIPLWQELGAKALIEEQGCHTDTNVLLTTVAQLKDRIEVKVNREFFGAQANESTRTAVANRISHLMGYKMSIGNITTDLTTPPRIQIETDLFGEETGLMLFDMPIAAEKLEEHCRNTYGFG